MYRQGPKSARSFLHECVPAGVSCCLIRMGMCIDVYTSAYQNMPQTAVGAPQLVAAPEPHIAKEDAFISCFEMGADTCLTCALTHIQYMLQTAGTGGALCVSPEAAAESEGLISCFFLLVVGGQAQKITQMTITTDS